MRVIYDHEWHDLMVEHEFKKNWTHAGALGDFAFADELCEIDFVKSRELQEPVSVGWNDHLPDGILNQS